MERSRRARRSLELGCKGRELEGRSFGGSGGRCDATSNLVLKGEGEGIEGRRERGEGEMNLD